MFSSQHSRDSISFGSENGGIRSLTLGGNSGKKDKIFVSNGAKIVGLSKKGKPFFSLTSNSSEAIEQILVQGSTIWCRQTGGGYTKYTNGEETEFFQVAEGVNWLEYENFVNKDNIDSEAHLDALLGCHDRSIRVIRNGECISNLGVDVNVTSLGCYDKNR